MTEAAVNNSKGFFNLTLVIFLLQDRAISLTKLWCFHSSLGSHVLQFCSKVPEATAVVIGLLWMIVFA